MKFKEIYKDGPVLIEPSVFSDSRGYFFETYNNELFVENGLPFHFKQDNESLSSKGVLRGLHFQNPPYEQGKLIRVAAGSVLDIVVDIRKKSTHYGRYFAVEINDENKNMLWIPPGFAHGFIALADHTLFLYKCTNVYHKEAESGILWNDPSLNINWGSDNPKVSAKDLQLPDFNNFNNLF